MRTLKNSCLLAAAAAMLGGTFAATFLPSPAEAQFAAAIVAQTMARTPLCSEHPDYPVVGRVIAYYSTDPRPVRMAFVGCFPDMATCDAWRKEAMQPLNPPIVANRCEARR